MKLASLAARQILDSRGTPTVEVDAVLDDGSFGRAAVPSGASTGSHEALELRDGDKALYQGKSVLKAVGNVVGPILDALKGTDVASQRTVDEALISLDGMPNKATLGANAILGVSMAVCRARAMAQRQPLWQSLAEQYDVSLVQDVPLPVPMMNVINGGKHADSGLSFQECMIIPTGFDSFSDALRAGAEIFMTLKTILHAAGLSTAVGDEGGFAPHIAESREAFSLLVQAIEKSGYEGRVKLGIDAAASEFYNGGVYELDGQTFDSSALVAYYGQLAKEFPIVSLEDSHSEDDWDGFAQMLAKDGSRLQLVGDDLLVTNTKRIEQAIQKKACNAVLIKVNQIGTVSETVDAIQLTQKSGWNAIVSHRSGETEDTFISHFAVGLRCGQIKTGSLSRTDRVCKYNELLRIEEQVGKRGVYVSPFSS